MPRRLVGSLLVVLVIATFAALAQAQVVPVTTQQPAPAPVASPTPTLTPTAEQVAAAEAKRKAELRTQALKARRLRHVVKKYRNLTWYWRDVMQKDRTSRPYFAHASKNIDKLQGMARIWKRRANSAAHQAHNPPMKWAWLCIHSHEGAWNSSSNPKYDGGLQMNYDFQNTYGSKWLRLKGPAYNWTMWEQIWTAVRAWRSRGFTPWPNTRIPCGV